MEIKTIGIASDHAGFALKQFVKKYLEERDMSIRTTVPTQRIRAITATSAMLWPRALSRARYSPASPSAVAAKAST